MLTSSLFLPAGYLSCICKTLISIVLLGNNRFVFPVNMPPPGNQLITNTSKIRFSPLACDEFSVSLLWEEGNYEGNVGHEGYLCVTTWKVIIRQVCDGQRVSLQLGFSCRRTLKICAKLHKSGMGFSNQLEYSMSSVLLLHNLTQQHETNQTQKNVSTTVSHKHSMASKTPIHEH